MSLKVLVTGATGKQGGALSRVLLSKGHRVVALTRNPDSEAANKLKKLGASVVKGDLEDRSSVERAAQGVDALFSVSTPFDSGGIKAETKQGINVADAAKDAGVRHLVYTSVPRADEHTGIPHFDTKERVEQHIRNIGVPYTIIGPAFFMDNLVSPWWLPGLQQGVFAIALSPNRKWNVIGSEDIGKFATMVIENREKFLGQRIDIASDEITPTQVAETLTRLSGRNIRHEQTPIEDVRAYNEDFALMFEYFDNVGMRIDTAALRRDYPAIAWQTFDQWARKQDWNVLKKTTAA